MEVQAFSKGRSLVKDSMGKVELQSVMKMIFFSYAIFKSASVSAPSYFNLTTLTRMAHSIGTWEKLPCTDPFILPIWDTFLEDKLI